MLLFFWLVLYWCLKELHWVALPVSAPLVKTDLFSTCVVAFEEDDITEHNKI